MADAEKQAQIRLHDSIKVLDQNSPDGVASHLSMLAEAAITEAVEAERAAKDSAYEERNRIVAALAKLFPAGLKQTNILGWEPEWHGCVYIDLPTGQVSWHYHDSQAHLFDGLPPYEGEWDGHDTPEKYRRLAAIEARALAPEPEG